MRQGFGSIADKFRDISFNARRGNSSEKEEEPLLGGSKQENNSLLIEAAIQGDTASIERLLDGKKIDINFQSKSVILMKKGVTALYAASEKGHLQVVKKLLGEGADANIMAINVTTKNISSALHAASQNGYSEIVKDLLKGGANVNLKMINGTSIFTALYISSQNGHIGVVETLLEAGADANLSTRTTPLMIASKNGHTGVVEKLLKAGADLEKATHGSEKPLFIACKNNQVKCAYLLYLAGANVDCLLKREMFSGNKSIRKELGVSPEMTKCITDIIDIEKIRAMNPDVAQERIKETLRQLSVSPGIDDITPPNYPSLPGVSLSSDSGVIEIRDRALAAKTQISPSSNPSSPKSAVVSPTNQGRQ